MSRRPPARKKPALPSSTPKKPSGLGQALRKITRDLLMFSTGLVLVIYEAVLRSGDPRESLIILYAAMMGLPAVLRYDENRRNADYGDYQYDDGGEV